MAAIMQQVLRQKAFVTNNQLTSAYAASASLPLYMQGTHKGTLQEDLRMLPRNTGSWE